MSTVDSETQELMIAYYEGTARGRRFRAQETAALLPTMEAEATAQAVRLRDFSLSALGQLAGCPKHGCNLCAPWCRCRAGRDVMTVNHVISEMLDAIDDMRRSALNLTERVDALQARSALPFELSLWLPSFNERTTGWR
jgi:hypothetical protein